MTNIALYIGIEISTTKPFFFPFFFSFIFYDVLGTKRFGVAINVNNSFVTATDPISDRLV